MGRRRISKEGDGERRRISVEVPPQIHETLTMMALEYNTSLQKMLEGAAKNIAVSGKLGETLITIGEDQLMSELRRIQAVVDQIKELIQKTSGYIDEAISGLEAREGHRKADGYQERLRQAQSEIDQIAEGNRLRDQEGNGSDGG